MKNNSFLNGITSGLPICVGYLSVAFAFGIFATESGMSLLQALLISMTNVTSAGQLAAVPIMATGGSLAELALAQLVINLRYALMSVSLSQKLDKDVRAIDRFLIAFVNTDEVFAVTAAREGTANRKFLYGLILTPYLGWSLGTLLGAGAGQILPAAVTSALGIAIYGMFIAILIPPAKKHRATAVCILTAVAFSCVFSYIPYLSSIPGGFTIIICAVAASVIFALLAPIRIPEEADDHA